MLFKLVALVLELCNKTVIISYKYLLQIFLMVSHCCSIFMSDSLLTPWTAACQASLSFPEFAEVHVHQVGDAI